MYYLQLTEYSGHYQTMPRILTFGFRSRLLVEHFRFCIDELRYCDELPGWFPMFSASVVPRYDDLFKLSHELVDLELPRWLSFFRVSAIYGQYSVVCDYMDVCRRFFTNPLSDLLSVYYKVAAESFSVDVGQLAQLAVAEYKRQFDNTNYGLGQSRDDVYWDSIPFK